MPSGEMVTGRDYKYAASKPSFQPQPLDTWFASVGARVSKEMQAAMQIGGRSARGRTGRERKNATTGRCDWLESQHNEIPECCRVWNWTDGTEMARGPRLIGSLKIIERKSPAPRGY